MESPPDYEQQQHENLKDLFLSRGKAGSRCSSVLPNLGPISPFEAQSNPEQQETAPLNIGTITEDSSTTTASAENTAERRLVLSSRANLILQEARRILANDEHQSAEHRTTEEAITKAVDEVCSARNLEIDDIARANVIVHLQRDLLGWGILQQLVDDPEVTDIHCYDYQTVAVQRGKKSQTTGLHWPSLESYSTFIDRVLFKLGKSLSNQQHTVDGAFSDGTRVCAMHESVCGSRGPLLTIRIPRIRESSLKTLLDNQVAPPLIINYLAALIGTCEHTLIVAGETGTGKTTLVRCLGSQFIDDESIIAVEDTPEVNFQHPYFRSLVARPANTEGVGEVALQDHIKATLRLCPTRVVLGEIRTPEAAESFIEAAQTGHCGISTVHARSAEETLVRLETLLGRVQRGVQTSIIRQQIALAIDVVVWMLRERSTGRIRIAQAIEVGRFVNGEIEIRPMFELKETGEEPRWEKLSSSSLFAEALQRKGINLEDAPRELLLNPSQKQKKASLNKEIVIYKEQTSQNSDSSKSLDVVLC